MDFPYQNKHRVTDSITLSVIFIYIINMLLFYADNIPTIMIMDDIRVRSFDMKKICAVILSGILCMFLLSGFSVNAEESDSALEISSPHAILMETTTGTVLYEKDADTARAPASVTKVMTMLLIFDALEEGKIKLTNEVTVSEFAASMGGSQVFLEPGETQTVETMLKCISVASANDACVAIAGCFDGVSQIVHHLSPFRRAGEPLHRQ